LLRNFRDDVEERSRQDDKVSRFGVVRMRSSDSSAPALMIHAGFGRVSRLLEPRINGV
jgi:hypothetical protein